MDKIIVAIALCIVDAILMITAIVVVFGGRLHKANSLINKHEDDYINKDEEEERLKEVEGE